MKEPKYQFGDEVYFVEKSELFYGTVIGLSYVEKIDGIIYLVKIDEDANQPHQTREEFMDVDRIVLVEKLKEEANKYWKEELIKYDNLLKVEPNDTIVKKQDLETKKQTV